MTTFYTYDPVGPTFAGKYREGDTFQRVDTGASVVCQGVAVPEWGLYEAVEDATTCPRYYQPPTIDLSFTGTVGQADGRVVETVVCTRSSMDELLVTKDSERSGHANFVAVQSVRSTNAPNLWISLDVDQRRAVSSFNQFLTDRHKDRVLGRDSSVGYDPEPTGADPLPNSYWPRDFSIVLIRDSNGNRLITPVDEPAWGQVLKDMGGYDVAIRDANVAVSQAFETAAPTYFSDGTELPAEWDALAAIDVTDSSYGWPTYYIGAQSVGVRVWP